jgi:hypothetical protein
LVSTQEGLGGCREVSNDLRNWLVPAGRVPSLSSIHVIRAAQTTLLSKQVTGQQSILINW